MFLIFLYHYGNFLLIEISGRARADLADKDDGIRVSEISSFVVQSFRRVRATMFWLHVKAS